jgi:hypothetical protein
MADKPDLKVVEDLAKPAAPIAKPSESDLDEFKSDETPVAVVETLLAALPHHPLPQAEDFARLHPDETTYWSSTLCFINVPIKGQARDTLHLISNRLANLLPPKRIKRFRLALATKPYDVFFLCHVPVPNNANVDNTWIQSNLEACEQAKSYWVMATSQKAAGLERYEITFTKDKKNDAFPVPKWPTQSLDELISVTFKGRKITKEDDPAFARLIGAKPSVT